MNFNSLIQDDIIKIILNFANKETCIRAVLLNGSRVNKNAPVDKMQDYDVVFFIKDLANNDYRIDDNWIYDYFGNPVIVQQNDNKNNSYIFLMQFEDFRIDLSFESLKKMSQRAKQDSLSMWLLDKDNMAPKLPEPNESSYFIQKPDEKTYNATINEAWWIQPYIAKGIWRDEFPYVRRVYDVYLMKAIRALIDWDIAYNYNWKVNLGKAGKWYKNYLNKKEYQEFIELHATTNYEQIWDSLEKAGNFIRKVGSRVADKLNYQYPFLDDERVRVYLSKVREELINNNN